MALVAGTAPTVVALDLRSGSVTSCTAVPLAPGSRATGEGGTLLTDQADADVVVVAGAAAGRLELSRTDPARGAVRWQRTLDASEAGSVTVVGDTVVVDDLDVQAAEASQGHPRAL